MDRFEEKPYRAYRDRRTGKICIRFTHLGQRRNFSTGETDPRRAEKKADALFEEVTSGDYSPTRRVRGSADLAVLLAEWIADVETEVSAPMAAEYQRYAFSLFEPYFRSLAGFTTRACSDYVRRRLRKVKAKTVRKELSGVRRFLAWCEENRYLAEAPLVKPVPKSATGTEGYDGKRRQVRVDLTPEQVEAILAQLPERARGGVPAREFFTVMWETGLRRATLWRLERPTHHRIGTPELRLAAEIDKSRYARAVPLSDRAAECLDRVGPKRGAVFGKVALLGTLRRAALDAGLPADVARHLSYHDIRHARATYWGEVTTDLNGMAFLLGHKHVTTTAGYVHARRKAAEQLVQLGADDARLHSDGRATDAGAEKKSRGGKGRRNDER